jgi:hypothetical protein
MIHPYSGQEQAQQYQKLIINDGGMALPGQWRGNGTPGTMTGEWHSRGNGGGMALPGQ